MRKKKCKVCREWFIPDRSFQEWCKPDCAIELVKIKKEKKKQKDLARRKQDILTLPELLNKAQKSFNAYIREMDKGKPCPSCGRPYDPTYWDCGHYLSVGAFPELRFEESNAAGQCRSCNRGGEQFGKKRESTIRSRYRATLIERIGLEKVEWLEGPHPAKNYTREDVRQIDALYKQKLKEMRKNQ
jgi:hypothetical protein